MYKRQLSTTPGGLGDGLKRQLAALAHDCAAVSAGAVGGASGGGCCRRALSLHGRAYRGVHVVFLWVVVFDALALPIQLAYLELTSAMGWLLYAMIAADVLYVARIFVRFRTSYMNEQSVEVFDLRQIRTHYLASDFTLDLLASWPHDLLALALGAPLWVHTALRCTRLLNVRYLFHAFVAWRARLADDDLLGGFAANMAVIALCCHACACAWRVMGLSLIHI